MSLKSNILEVWSLIRPQACYESYHRLSQLLKGAVVVTLCQNEAEVKCQMDIDSHISLTEQAGKIRLVRQSILSHDHNRGGADTCPVISSEGRANCSFI